MGFAQDMAEGEETWAATEAAEGGGGGAVFTDGRHEAVIDLARLEENDFGWQLHLRFRGIDSKTKQSARINKWESVPPRDEHAKYLKADLIMLGFSVTKTDEQSGTDYEDARPLAELEEVCEKEEIFLGAVCQIFVKTTQGDTRDYQNVYLNGVLEERVKPEEWLASRGVAGAETNGSANTGSTFTDDDIPFMPTIMSSGRWGI